MKSRLELAALLVAAAALTLSSGCSKKDAASGSGDAAATADAASDAASDAAPHSGKLLKFFPPDGKGGYTRVVLADLDNYAEAKLMKDGTEVAFLAIAESDKLPYVKAKFERATEKLDGFPMLNVGTVQTALLVQDRFQVKVTSQVLDAKGRAELLATFDLKGLAK